MKTFYEWLANETELFQKQDAIAKVIVRLIQSGVDKEEAFSSMVQKHNITDDFDLAMIRSWVDSQTR